MSAEPRVLLEWKMPLLSDRDGEWRIVERDGERYVQCLTIPEGKWVDASGQNCSLAVYDAMFDRMVCELGDVAGKFGAGTLHLGYCNADHSRGWDQSGCICPPRSQAHKIAAHKDATRDAMRAREVRE